LVRLVIVLAAAGGGTYWGLSQYHHLKIDDQHKLELAELQSSWLERANWVDDVPAPEAYRDERKGLANWYFTSLTDMNNHFEPSYRNYYRVEQEMDAPGKKKKKNDDAALRKQYYTLVKNVFDSLKDGSYNPQFSAGSSSLRLDLLKIAKRDDGQKGFRIDLVLWGAQRQLDKTRQPTGEIISKMNTSASFSGMNIKLFDDKGKVAAEMPVSGDPEIKVDYPERWIEEFPPQAVIGYYNLPPVPANAEKMELTMTVVSRSPNGGDISGNFKWDIPVDAQWKLAPGETWDGATTEERSKDYIDGKAEN
jgi:hypothetical protein